MRIAFCFIAVLNVIIACLTQLYHHVNKAFLYQRSTLCQLYRGMRVIPACYTKPISVEKRLESGHLRLFRKNPVTHSPARSMFLSVYIEENSAAAMVLRNGLRKLNFQAVATTQDMDAGRIAVSHTILCITPYFFKTYITASLGKPRITGRSNH